MRAGRSGDRPPAHRPAAAPRRGRPGDGLGGDDRARPWSRSGPPAAPPAPRRTFTAYGHHYALVVVEGLTPDSATRRTRCSSTSELVWPLPEHAYPPSVIRTRAADDGDQPVSLIFGSCREATPHATGPQLPPDALDAYARRLMADPPTPDRRPDLLVLLGDQVYADETSPTVRRLLRRRRAAGPTAPGRPGGHASTSTPSSTWSRGATRRSAGCSPPCRA